MTMCVRCFISGKVQGVFYRASARYQAEQLGVKGYAHNMPDGRVEVLACGETDAVEQLKTWLAKGPDQAQVTTVTCEVVDAVTPVGFTTG